MQKAASTQNTQGFQYIFPYLLAKEHKSDFRNHHIQSHNQYLVCVPIYPINLILVCTNGNLHQDPKPEPPYNSRLAPLLFRLLRKNHLQNLPTQHNLVSPLLQFPFLQSQNQPNRQVVLYRQTFLRGCYHSNGIYLLSQDLTTHLKRMYNNSY